MNKTQNNEIDQLKKRAAESAVELVKSGMVLGLGTGSTTKFALEILAEKIKNNKISNIVGVPTSEQTKEMALKLNIPITSIGENPILDLTIDGADEIDSDMNLIKGGGGALLREKIVAEASKIVVIMVDESKVSKKLGTKWAVPIEVIPFALNSVKIYLESFCNEVKLRRKNDKIFITDEENYILDCNFGIIENPAELACKIIKKSGIVEHGLFINLATDIIIAESKGLKHLKR